MLHRVKLVYGIGLLAARLLNFLLIVKKEDMIEYQEVKKFTIKYQMKVYILSKSSSIIVRNNNIIEVDTRIL